jgi:formylglycine-generating enzyme required for sulfatase activity
MNYEHQFQRDSGLTDADTIFELGKRLNAAFVIAGYITKLGDRNLVLVSIMDVESLQQIAGDYRTYRTIEEIDTLIPEIAKKLADAVPRDTSKLPGLSVPPFNISRDVNQNDAQVLAQILSCDLANGSKYAILPRTDSIEKVMEEHNRQRDGTTDQERVKRLGAGRNAQFVLSGAVEKLGTLNKFAADILDINDGSYMDGYEERYTNFSQGFELMPKLAVNLNGGSAPGGAVVPDRFVRVEGGTFRMGSNSNDNERPVHTVTVKTFHISKFEVTQREWVEIMGTNPANFKGDDLPVEQVSWYDAVEYCNKLSLKEGLNPAYRGSGNSISCDFSASGYRLPTEAEWEYAARGGNKDPMSYEYSGGNSVDAAGWYSGNSGGRTHPAGTKVPNSLGLYDMSGNVWEWCWDWYGSYSGSSQTDPRGASSGTYRGLRGGSWFNSAQYLRSAVRVNDTPSYRNNNLGFRLVRP